MAQKKNNSKKTPGKPDDKTRLRVRNYLTLSILLIFIILLYYISVSKITASVS